MNSGRYFQYPYGQTRSSGADRHSNSSAELRRARDMLIQEVDCGSLQFLQFKLLQFSRSSQALFPNVWHGEDGNMEHVTKPFPMPQCSSYTSDEACTDPIVRTHCDSTTSDVSQHSSQNLTDDCSEIQTLQDSDLADDCSEIQTLQDSDFSDDCSEIQTLQDSDLADDCSEIQTTQDSEVAFRGTTISSTGAEYNCNETSAENDSGDNFNVREMKFWEQVIKVHDQLRIETKSLAATRRKLKDPILRSQTCHKIAELYKRLKLIRSQLQQAQWELKKYGFRDNLQDIPDFARCRFPESLRRKGRPPPQIFLIVSKCNKILSKLWVILHSNVKIIEPYKDILSSTIKGLLLTKPSEKLHALLYPESSSGNEVNDSTNTSVD